MAETGLVPFASTYSVFATRRAYDFICLDIAEPGLNVNIVGGLPGLTTGYGPSHQATEDVAIFRGIPGLTIVDPCDSVDIAQAVPQLAACDGPTYLRLLRGQVPTVLDEYDYTFELGKAKVLRGGADVVFVSSGLMTMRALLAADELAKHRVDVAVVHTPTLKPFDADTVLAEVDSDRLAVTLENHTVVGGCSRRSPPRRCGAECTAPSRRWRCPTSSSPRGRCRRCTTVMDYPRSASSHRCSNGCKIDVDIQMLTLKGAVHVGGGPVAAAPGEDQSARAGADGVAPGYHHGAAVTGHAPGGDGSVRCAADQPRHPA
jgi:transketolase